MNKRRFTYFFEKQHGYWLIDRGTFQNDDGFLEIASLIEEDLSSTDGYNALGVLGSLRYVIDRNQQSYVDSIRGHELFFYDDRVFIQNLYADELAVAIKIDNFILHLEKYIVVEKMRDYKGRTFEFGYDIGGIEAHKLLNKYIDER